MSFKKIAEQALKQNFDNNVKLCYMDTDSFIVHMKTKDAYVDLPKDVEKRSDTSHYEVNRPLRININKKVVGLMKDDFWWKSNDHVCCINTKNK